jgi:tripartite ATP-independent transporter DctP family solute receptor
MLPYRARAAEFTLRLGNDVPETHSVHKRLVEAAGLIGTDTGGRVEIQVFPNSQLGSSVDMFSQVRSGALDMMTVGTPLGNTVQLASITGIAFAFPNLEQAWAAADGELGDHVRKVVSEQAGIVMFDQVWDFGGYRHTTTSTRPIVTPADFQGMKLRVPVTPLYNSTFRALGASPVSINYVEVYSALQTGVADGQENPLALIETGRFYEVQKYLSLTGHIWDAVTLVANPGSLSRLPADLQEIITARMNEAAKKQRQDSLDLNAQIQQSLADKGLIINEVEKEPFRQALKDAGYYTEWKGKYGEEAWALLEKYADKLT